MNMIIPITISGFSKKSLSIKPRGIFSFAPKILLGGRPVPRTGFGYFIRDDAGNNVEFRLRYNFLDPIPELTVGDKQIVVAAPIKAIHHIWLCSLFLILVLYGGIIGGVCSLLALNVNYIIFRAVNSPFQKYLFSAVVILISWALYFAIVFFLVHEVGFGRRT
jgi:hypothetical protein